MCTLGCLQSFLNDFIASHTKPFNLLQDGDPVAEIRREHVGIQPRVPSNQQYFDAYTLKIMPNRDMLYVLGLSVALDGSMFGQQYVGPAAKSALQKIFEHAETQYVSYK